MSQEHCCAHTGGVTWTSRVFGNWYTWTTGDGDGIQQEPLPGMPRVMFTGHRGLVRCLADQDLGQPVVGGPVLQPHRWLHWLLENATTWQGSSATTFDAMSLATPSQNPRAGLFGDSNQEKEKKTK